MSLHGCIQVREYANVLRECFFFKFCRLFFTNIRSAESGFLCFYFVITEKNHLYFHSSSLNCEPLRDQLTSVVVLVRLSICLFSKCMEKEARCLLLAWLLMPLYLVQCLKRNLYVCTCMSVDTHFCHCVQCTEVGCALVPADVLRMGLLPSPCVGCKHVEGGTDKQPNFKVDFQVIFVASICLQWQVNAMYQ